MQFTDQPNVAFPNFVLVRTFSEAENLNYDLAKIIRKYCTIAVVEGDEFVGGGFRTEDIFFDLADEAVATLKRMISEACGAYMGQAIPAVYAGAEALQGKVELKGRARILRARQSIQSHIHENSLVSGSYYVSLPKSVYDTDEPDGDLILVHPAADSLPDNTPLPMTTEMHIRVNEGMLFLHPSFVPHYVPPFQGGGERLSVSFDIRPSTPVR